MFLGTRDLGYGTFSRWGGGCAVFVSSSFFRAGCSRDKAGKLTSPPRHVPSLWVKSQGSSLPKPLPARFSESLLRFCLVLPHFFKMSFAAEPKRNTCSFCCRPGPFAPVTRSRTPANPAVPARGRGRGDAAGPRAAAREHPRPRRRGGRAADFFRFFRVSMQGDPCVETMGHIVCRYLQVIHHSKVS